MLKVDLSRDSARFLKRLSASSAKHARQLAGKITALRETPEPHDSIQMRGKASSYRRTDAGEYRVIYRVEGDTLMVVLVGKRKM